MRLLVTGGTGLVGTAIAPLLAARHEVTLLDRRSGGDRRPSFVHADVRDQDAVERACEGMEAVLHLAAIPLPWLAPAEEIHAVNVTGTETVLEAARRAGIERVVLLSSEAVLGFVFGEGPPCPEYLPIDEAHPCRPQDPYGQSKLAAEQVAQVYAARYGMTIPCLRPAWIWVEAERARYRELVEHPESWVKGLWSYVGGEDLAAAVHLALTKPLQGADPYYIVADDLVGGRSPAEWLQYVPECPLSPPQGATLISNAKAKRHLGWQPKQGWQDLI